MTTSIFFIIMFAAVLHASWNAILKKGEDKRLQMTAIAVGHLPFAPIAIYFAPSLDLACWPYLVFGAIFHLGYQYYLVESYKKGDLSQVYPIEFFKTYFSHFHFDTSLDLLGRFRKFFES